MRVNKRLRVVVVARAVFVSLRDGPLDITGLGGGGGLEIFWCVNFS